MSVDVKKRPVCGKHCARWIKRFKRCVRGAVSAGSFADECDKWLPKEG